MGSGEAAASGGRIRWTEALGRYLGALLAPVTGAVSRIRQARMFHPEGFVYAARVEPAATAPDLHAVGERLAGPALVRLSSAWWRGDKEWPDVLGLAIRLQRRGAAADANPAPDDQDLLLATIRFPWTTLLAPLATRVSSFLWNHYHAVSPFEVEGVGRVKLRLRSPRMANTVGLPRAAHLQRAVADGRAVFLLEARRLRRPPFRRSWEPIARAVLEKPVPVDQAALRFSPFRSGRGLHPTGFVHALRIRTYASSQRNRPAPAPRTGATIHRLQIRRHES